MNEYTTAGFGAAINGKHTWKDYGLVIGNTDIVGEPSPKTNYIEVPGSSIRIDLTETLTGQVEYESRQLKFSLGKMEREDVWPLFYRTLLKTYRERSVGCSGSGAGCILPRTGRNLRIFQKWKARHIYPDGGCGRI